MRRSLNLKFIGVLLVGIVLFGVAVHFLHAFQVRRNASALLDYAAKEEENGDLPKAIFYLRRFLGFRPTANKALLKLGVLSADHAERIGSLKMAKEAYLTLNRVLLKDEANEQARNRIIPLAMKLRRFSDARLHIEKLKKNSPQSGKEVAQLTFQTGVCFRRENNFATAIKVFEQAVKRDQAMLGAYGQLAFLYRYRLQQPDKADEVMRRMVKANPKSLEACLGSAGYFLTNAKRDPYRPKKVGEDENLNQAARDVQSAMTIAPKDERVLLFSGKLLLTQARFAKLDKDVETERQKKKKARELFVLGIAEHPKNPDFYVALADLDAKDGQVAEGLKTLQKGLKVVTSKTEVLNQLIDLLVQKGELAEALEVINRLDDEKQAGPLVAYQQARVFVAKDEWGKAGDLLNKIRNDDRVLDLPALVKNIDLLRGLCFEQLGNPDQALLAYQDAVKYDPLFIPGRIKVARTYLMLDRLSEAINEYSQIALFKDAPPATPLALARLLILQNLRLPTKDRNWQLVKDRLAEANRVPELKDEVEVTLLEADALLLEDAGQVEKARQLLLHRKNATPDQVELWIALAVLAGREKDKKGHEKIGKALSLLDEAAKRPKLKDSVELTLARMRYLAREPDTAKATKALAELEETVLDHRRGGGFSICVGCAIFSCAAKGEDRQRLLASLGNAYYQVGDNSAAERLWQLLAKENPRNLGLRLLLFDLALVSDKEDKCRQFLQEIRELEGHSGTYWRYAEASLIYAKAKPKEGETPAPEALQMLTEARQYLSEVAKFRPSWFRVAALEGMINDLEKRPEKAIADFQEAIRLGDRRPAIIRRLVDLLDSRNRPEDVERAINKLLNQEEALLSAGLGKYATASLLRQNEVDRALEIAQRSIDSKNFKDHLWLGRVLYEVGRHEQAVGRLANAREKLDQAEKQLKEACRLAPKRAEPWKIRVHLLVKMDKKQEAEEVIAQATKEMDAPEVPLTLAHCHDALDNKDLAEKHFLAALKNNPTSVVVIESLASFYSRIGSQDKAETYWRQLLYRQVEPEVHRRARRSLALAIGIGRDYKHFQEALELLEENLRDKKQRETPDLTVKAILFATRANHRRDAIRIFEDINLLDPSNRFTLARLYGAAENWPKVHFHMQILLQSANKVPPSYYAFYIRQLLELKQLQKAENWLAALEKRDTDATTTLEIKARLLQAQGDDKAALAMLKRLSERKDLEPGRLAQVVDELAQIAVANEAYSRMAEDLYRAKIGKAPDQASLLALADFLGRNKRVGEALDLCEQALAKGSPQQPIALALDRLRTSQAEDKFIQRVEGWFKDIGADPAQMLPYLAELRDLQGQYDAAVALFRKVLEKNPRDVITLNNLAWILAHKGKTAEALEMIESALAIAGPLPELLDTRGVIYLEMNKTKEAVRDLEECVAMAGSPVRHFHLARAYLQDKKLSEARIQLDKAHRKVLTASRLHPLERHQYDQLIQGLEIRRQLAEPCK